MIPIFLQYWYCGADDTFWCHNTAEYRDADDDTFTCLFHNIAVKHTQ